MGQRYPLELMIAESKLPLEVEGGTTFAVFSSATASTRRAAPNCVPGV